MNTKKSYKIQNLSPTNFSAYAQQKKTHNRHLFCFHLQYLSPSYFRCIRHSNFYHSRSFSIRSFVMTLPLLRSQFQTTYHTNKQTNKQSHPQKPPHPNFTLQHPSALQTPAQHIESINNATKTRNRWNIVQFKQIYNQYNNHTNLFIFFVC